MKKHLVLAAAIALFATPALAANVASTKHNLAGTTGGTTEICVFCHTPHGGSVVITTAPLWNRTNDNTGPTNAYTSGTFNGGDQNWNLGSMPLCFSCHDGIAAEGEIINDSLADDISADIGLSAATNLGSDGYTNDHPVGFYYSTAQNADAELWDESDTDVVPLIPNDLVECASCHDVHDNTNAPFLIMNNAGSALCRACHIK